MKNFKALLIVLMLACTAGVRAQDLSSIGFTVQVYMGMYSENGEIQSYDLDDLYNVSITDQFLVHNILTEGVATNSQLYKVSNLKKQTIDGEATFTFDATSGLSGNVYKYEFSFDSEGSVTVTRTQPDGSAEVFLGTSSIFKTFKQ